MNFDCFLFDLDNCLLNIPHPSEYFDNILVETIKRLTGAPLPNRQERNKFWYSGEKYIEILKKWGVGDLNHFWMHFDEIDFKHRKELLLKKQLTLFEDVREALENLFEKGKKIAIISNSADYIVEYIVKEFNIKHFFHEILGLGFDKDQGIAKPSPAGILSLLKKLNYDPNDSKALMTGDSILDVYAAKRAGIDACLIKRDLNKYPKGYKEWDYQPDYVIKRLDELFDL